MVAPFSARIAQTVSYPCHYRGVRIYIPASVALLKSTRIEPGIAYTVTQKIRELGETYQYGDLECEELASDYAAMASLDLPGNQELGRRMLVAAEVPEDCLSSADSQDYGYVEFSEPVRWRQACSILLDDEGVSELAQRAAEGNEAAWDELSQVSLAWFDISERTELVNTLDNTEKA